MEEQVSRKGASWKRNKWSSFWFGNFFHPAIVHICNPYSFGRIKNKQEPLKAGDIVKLDLGCHIDGYMAVVAHTLVVPEEPNSDPTDVDTEVGNVAVAAYNVWYEWRNI